MGNFPDKWEITEEAKRGFIDYISQQGLMDVRFERPSKDTILVVCYYKDMDICRLGPFPFKQGDTVTLEGVQIVLNLD